MATLNVQQDVDQSKDCKNFYFFDTTSLWNAISAPDGYDPSGLNGIDPSNISLPDSTLLVTLPDGTVVSFDLEVYADFDIARLIADGRNLIQFTIPYSDLGFGSTLADGMYKFTYILYNDALNVTYQSTCYFVNTCQVCCCLDQKLAKLNICTNCGDTYSKQVQRLYDLYLKRDSAQLLAGCGDYVGAQQVVDYLTTQCAIKTCDGCNQ